MVVDVAMIRFIKFDVTQTMIDITMGLRWFDYPDYMTHDTHCRCSPLTPPSALVIVSPPSLNSG